MKSQCLLTLNEPHSLVAESYKLLRTNLNFKSTNNQYKVVLLTSSEQEEGKSTTISNLAVAFAQSDKRVLLIDADLRLPRINSIFDIHRIQPGLSNLLIKELSIDSVVTKVPDLENLEILTAGTKNALPTELLNSEAFETLIKTCRQTYDVILIDTPPVLSFADASIISKVADGVLLVAAVRQTRKTKLVEAKKSLDKVGANVIGVVLTKVKFNKKEGYYRYTDKKKH